MRQVINKHEKISFRFLGVVLVALCLVSLTSCNRNPFSGSKLTSANYDQISLGMTKAQVENILGPPTSAETKDVLIYKKTTYRYEDGRKFAMITFKNDEVDGKDTNLGREP
jgi:outer membrane protein assembly factor BamE (lipoprotein component of BamABCDE complex)